MARINVIVAVTNEGHADRILADGIAAAVRTHPDMGLVEGEAIAASVALRLLAALPPAEPCALVLVGRAEHAPQPAAAATLARPDIIVLCVSSTGDAQLSATLHAVGLPEMLAQLRSLALRTGLSARERVKLVELAQAPRVEETPAVEGLPDRPLLRAAIAWIHAVLAQAVRAIPEAGGEKPWFGPGRETMLHELQATHLARADEALDTAQAQLAQALADAPAGEPLARAVRELGWSFLEVRALLLALAPEIDPVYQRCIGLLLDDMGRRVATPGLVMALLGDAASVRRELAREGHLLRWRAFEGTAAAWPGADEALRVDPALAAWLLGRASALAHDVRLRRVLRLSPWPGSVLLQGAPGWVHAAGMVSRLATPGTCIVLAGDAAGDWRAWIEHGAHAMGTRPVRVEAARVAALEPAEIEDAAIRAGRLARLDARPLVIDASAVEPAARDDDALRLLLGSALRAAGAAIVAPDEARVVRLLGSVEYEVRRGTPVDAASRLHAVREAVRGAGGLVSEAEAHALARRYPLDVDGLDRAMRLARARAQPEGGVEAFNLHFDRASRDVASEGLERVAQRLDAIFTLDDVVLPGDRKRQLVEIVDNVRFAPEVLEGWRFGEQLPYGRGVAALFHGPSGTGKTMAAMAIARALGVQVLRLDLSKVVSKYLGETEKNLDRVFDAAQRSGCALLIDEADALLGKRSEVKDAHDRYANIEVAYLLQRMEAYEGLAILTTNLRQNLDPAFLRRLRFLVDFPRPDAEAREMIWRRCLPEGSHAVDDATFRQLGRRLELTGGNIRQITLRAAFIAAAAGERIGLAHIAHAARAELAKIGAPALALDALEQRRAA